MAWTQAHFLEKTPSYDAKDKKRKNNGYSVHIMTHDALSHYCSAPSLRESMAKMVEKAELLLFDLDGLLVDTESFHWKAYQAACEKLGGTLPWTFLEYLSLSGSSATAVQEKLRKEQPELFVKYTWDDLYREKKAQLQILLSSLPIPLMPGVQEFIERYRAKPMAVVTNSSQSFTELVVKTHPFLALVRCWIYREKYKESKPSPEAYLLACHEMNVQPANALGFEDTLRGVNALLAAGCTPVLVNNSEPEFQKICAQKQIFVIPSFCSV